MIKDQNRTALVLYGSETGNAQDVAEELGRLAERLRFATRVVDLNSIQINELLHHTVVFLAISTTGQGDVPSNAQSFWKRLRSVRLKPGCLAGLRFASFGLGDSSYPKFNWAHRKLYNRFKQLGGEQLCDRGEADEQHPEGIDASFLPWSLKLRETLLDFFPLSTGSEPIPDNVFIPPKWSLTIEEPRSPDPEAIGDGDSFISNGNMATSNGTLHDSAVLRATLLSNSRVTPETHWQDVRMFEFSTPKIDYNPGDVLTIFPHNSAANVDDFLSIMKWKAIADRAVQFVPTNTKGLAHELFPPQFYDTKISNITLRNFITRHLDLNAIPRRSFFAAIAHFTDDEMQKDRLVEFTNPEYIDELFDYTTRPRRSILEVLQEFDTLQIPLKWIASLIPTIRGRQYSIASGGELKTSAEGLGRVQLLVAIVKYRTVIKKIREGLCTKYMAGLTPGTELDVQFSKGGMKHFEDRPAVMVGPGTGIAPIRSMLYERLAAGQFTDASSDRHILFFGGRNRSEDYFFEDDWNYLTPKMPLQIFTAFSRDQDNKIYVQDKIRQHAASVYNVLQDGVIYICGSSGKMPQAVREALIEVFEQEGHLERAAAETHLMHMEKNGRYQQETW